MSTKVVPTSNKAQTAPDTSTLETAHNSAYLDNFSPMIVQFPQNTTKKLNALITLI